MNNEKFERFYEKLVQEDLEYMENLKEKAKQESRKNNVILIVVAIIIICINSVVYILTYTDDKLVEENLFAGSLTLSLVLLIPILILWYAFKKNNEKQRYTKEFKERIVTKIVKAVSEDLEYQLSGKIDSRQYKNAEFFDCNDKYSSSELIYGKIEAGNDFKMTKVTTYEADMNENKIANEMKYAQIFNGLFVEIDLSKSLNMLLYLRNNRRTKWIHLTQGILRKMPYKDLKIELDSKEFEKIFTVYTSEEIKAKKIFTEENMQMFMDFYYDLNSDYEMTIKNKKIYIRFLNKKIFEVPILIKSSLDKQIIFKYYNTLKQILKFSDSIVNIIKYI